ncbi:MAG: hypothetical protein CM15mP18_4750 [Methanobacteriota archaeon]|nr:MAG: hypothetical protein CM15mP18_4750 [Euryarchaeota archaeon]
MEDRSFRKFSVATSMTWSRPLACSTPADIIDLTLAALHRVPGCGLAMGPRCRIASGPRGAWPFPRTAKMRSVRVKSDPCRFGWGCRGPAPSASIHGRTLAGYGGGPMGTMRGRRTQHLSQSSPTATG